MVGFRGVGARSSARHHRRHRAASGVKESASWGNNSSNFQRRGDDTRVVSWGIVTLGGDGGDSMSGDVDHASGSARGRGGDNDVVHGMHGFCRWSSPSAQV